MMLVQTCQECGAVFTGGPRAWFCPPCRAERRREADARAKARKRRGESRGLGIDSGICERCGGLYTVEASLQRFCPECQGPHAKEHDRRSGREYYWKNKDMINPARNVKRRAERSKEKKMKTCDFLLNAFSLQMVEGDHGTILFREVPAPSREELLGITSAIGHADTAAVLGVEMRRINVTLGPGSRVLVAQLVGGRLPEGATTLPDGFRFRFIEAEIT
jgi:uncharacterized Zn finger protein (UPF0148 family)